MGRHEGCTASGNVEMTTVIAMGTLVPNMRSSEADDAAQTSCMRCSCMRECRVTRMQFGPRCSTGLGEPEYMGIGRSLGCEPQAQVAVMILWNTNGTGAVHLEAGLSR